MRRYLRVLAPLGVLLVVGLVFRFTGSSEPTPPAPATPTAAAAQAPLPAQFRQAQPRHWRYLMMPQR